MLRTVITIPATGNNDVYTTISSTTYQHASSEIKALKELSNKYISGYSRVDVHFLYLFQDVYKPLKTSLITGRPDKVYFVTLDFKSKITKSETISNQHRR